MTQSSLTKSYLARLIHRTLLPQIISCSGRCNTSSARKLFHILRMSEKRSLNILLLNRSAFLRYRYPIVTRKMGEGHWCRVEGNYFDDWTSHYNFFITKQKKPSEQPNIYYIYLNLKRPARDRELQVKNSIFFKQIASTTATNIKYLNIHKQRNRHQLVALSQFFFETNTLVCFELRKILFIFFFVKYESSRPCSNKICLEAFNKETNETCTREKKVNDRKCKLERKSHQTVNFFLCVRFC